LYQRFGLNHWDAALLRAQLEVHSLAAGGLAASSVQRLMALFS